MMPDPPLPSSGSRESSRLKTLISAAGSYPILPWSRHNMHHGTLPDGTTLFIDANIFLHTILGNTRESKPSAHFLSQVERGIIHGTTSVIVLNEVLHRLLITYVVSECGIGPESAVGYLKSNPATVRDAKTVWEITDDIMHIKNLNICGISDATFARSLTIMQEYGLMSNDALHVASMDEYSITTLATYDRDFENISRISVWNPRDVK